MKTLTKLSALLITAATFTACSNPAIEPVGPARTAAPTAQTDTTATSSANPADRDVRNQRHRIVDDSAQSDQTGFANTSPIVTDTRVRERRPANASLEQAISF